MCMGIGQTASRAHTVKGNGTGSAGTSIKSMKSKTTPMAPNNRRGTTR